MKKENGLSTVLSNCRVVNEGKVETMNILIRNGMIEKISQQPINLPGTCQYIDISDRYVLPGLIDSQVHFREPGLTDKGTIETESRAAIAGGITSFIEQPNTKPPTINEEKLREKLGIASQTSWANYGFNLGATNDNLDDLRYMVEKHPSLFAGIKVFMGSSTGNMLVDDRKALEEIFQLPKLIITHCEDEATIKKELAYYQQEFGENIPIYLHAAIRNVEACYKSSSFAVELAKKHGTNLHVYHISTEEEIKLFEQNHDITNKLITAEVCLHHLWFNSDDYDRLGSKIKWNPAVKGIRHQTALREAFFTGKLDILATDHAPHTSEEKALPYTSCPSGAPMVQHLLQGSVELFGEENLPLIVTKACHNPALRFGIDRRGFVDEGYYADLVVFDTKHYQSPVNKDTILYKCGWSPLEGHVFNSKILGTFVNGELVYRNCFMPDEKTESFAQTRSAMALKFTK